MENQVFVSSKRNDEYSISLTKEELDAIPILIDMAMVYLWELYNKTKDDKFYNKHKEIIDRIAEFHKKNQGILAVGGFIEGKAEQVLKNNELNKVLEPFINKIKVKDEVVFYQKSVKIENHIGEFKDEFIGSITIYYGDNKVYKAIPIDSKFSIPYIRNGDVKVCYRKLVKNCSVLELNTEDYPIK